MWRFYLHNSKDMVRLGELTNPRSNSFNVLLNSPPQGSLQIKTSIPTAQLVKPLSTCVVGVKNGVPRVAGYVQNLSSVHQQINPWEQSGDLTIPWMGWLEKYNHRIIRPWEVVQVRFADIDAGQIVYKLHKLADIQYPLRITVGVIEPTQPRTITYTVGSNIGQSIKQLADIESGFDYEVTPFERVLNIRARIGQENRDIAWAFGARQQNIQQLTDDLDTSRLCNSMFAAGSSGASGFEQDAESMRDLDFLAEEYAALPGIVDNTNSILAAYAAEEVAVRGVPYRSWPFVPYPAGESDRVPSAFEDFNVGDTNSLYKVTGDGNDVRNQAIRIFGFGLAISDDGMQESVTSMQTTYGS